MSVENDGVLIVSRNGRTEPEPVKAEPPAPKLHRSNLSMALSVCGFVLVVGGSGGILAEIYHTGIVFSEGYSDYVKSSHEASGSGISLLRQSASRGLVKRDGSIAAARKEAAGIVAAGRSDSETAIQEGHLLSTVKDGAEQYQLLYLRNLKRSMMTPLMHGLEKVQEVLREEYKDPSYQVKIGFTTLAKDGSRKVELFPIPWDEADNYRMLKFECLSYPHINDGECVESDGPQKATPEPIAITPQYEGVHLPNSQQYAEALDRYRSEMGDLEEVVFQSVLDLKRFTSSHTELAGKDRVAVNNELSRLELGLTEIRQKIEGATELLELLKLHDNARERSVLLATFSERLMPNKLVPASSDPASRIQAWVTRVVPEQTSEAKRQRESEINRRSSGAFRSTRTLLANVWEALHSGKLGLSGWFFASGLEWREAGVPGRFETPVPLDRPEFAIPLWCIASAVCLMFIGVWRVARRRTLSMQTLQRGGIAIIPLCFVVLLFPVRAAYNVNAVTRSITDRIATDIIPYTVRGDYDARAAEIESRMEQAGVEIAASLTAQAHADATVIKNAGEQEKLRRENRLAMISGGASNLPALIDVVRFWEDHRVRKSDNNFLPLPALWAFRTALREAKVAYSRVPIPLSTTGRVNEGRYTLGEVFAKEQKEQPSKSYWNPSAIPQSYQLGTRSRPAHTGRDEWFFIPAPPADRLTYLQLNECVEPLNPGLMSNKPSNGYVQQYEFMAPYPGIHRCGSDKQTLSIIENLLNVGTLKQ